MSNLLDVTRQLPTITNFSIGRIRQADGKGLPTTGHILSHSPEELRETLEYVDTSHMLVLDDTSFSGTTSIIFERLVRQAFPDRGIQFTHGFLILNDGRLGNEMGAKQRLERLGSVAVGGMAMHTPVDDGWHFFDMVEQANFSSHIDVVLEMLHSPDGRLPVSKLPVLFPEFVTHDELVAAQKVGRFIAQRVIEGELHVRNPQLLPNVVAEGHLLHPRDWRDGHETTVEHLKSMNKILRGENHE